MGDDGEIADVGEVGHSGDKDGVEVAVNGMAYVDGNKLWNDSHLELLLTGPLFPSMASTEVIVRSGIRALAGFSNADPDDRDSGNDWPGQDADGAVLECLKKLIVCSSAVYFQDDEILDRLGKLQSHETSPWVPNTASQSAVIQATSKACDFVNAFFFDNFGSDTAAKTQLLNILSLCHSAEPNGNSAHRIAMDDHSGSVGPKSVLMMQPLYSSWADREEIDDQEEIDARIFSWESHEILNGLYKRGRGFGFWSHWFEGLILGKPLDWELQKEIALIPDSDWEKGPEWFAGIIEKIRLKYRTATTPRLFRSDIDAVFHVEAEDALVQDVLEFSCERIETALQNALASSGANGLLEDSYETIVIRRALDNHQERASLLATGFYDACLSFQRNIGDRYPDDTALINLQNALYVVVEVINEQHEDARKRCARLACLAQPEPVTAQDREELALVPEFLAAELENEARKTIESDVEHILTQERPAKSVRARFTNWVTTVSLWMDKAMKGDKRAKWLAGIVSRLVRWWSGSDQDEE